MPQVQPVQRAQRLADSAAAADRAGDIDRAIDLYTEANGLLTSEISKKGLSERDVVEMERHINSFTARADTLKKLQTKRGIPADVARVSSTKAMSSTTVSMCAFL